MATLALENGNTLEFYDFGVGVLTLERGAAYTQPLLTQEYTPGKLVETHQNGNVSAWLDATDNHRDAVQLVPAGQPHFNPSGWDGINQGTLHFNGGQLLTLGNWSVAPAGTDAPLTVLAVMRAAGPQNAAVAGWWSGAGDGFVWAELKSSNGLTLPDLTRTWSLGTSTSPQ